MQIPQKAIDKCSYNADGTITESYRNFLKKLGTTDEEIQQIEKMEQEEREMDRLIAAHNSSVSGGDLHIARQGLSIEEELTQGFISLDDF
jgi:glycerol-3-phosphate dehydrogenase